MNTNIKVVFNHREFTLWPLSEVGEGLLRVGLPVDDQDESLSLRSSGIFFGLPSPPMRTCTVCPEQSSSPPGSLVTSYSMRRLDLPIFPAQIFTSTSSSYFAGAL